jgi:hypothetical protein
VLIRMLWITQTEVVAQDSLRQTCVRSRHRPAATASADGLAHALAWGRAWQVSLAASRDVAADP